MPDATAPSNGFTPQDVAAAIWSGNEALMQWYALTHQTTIPVNPNQPIYSSPLPGGGQINVPQNTILVIGLVIVAAVLIFK